MKTNLKRKVNYKDISIEEIEKVFESKGKEFICDGDSKQIVSELDYDYRPVTLVKVEIKKKC